MGSNTYQTWSCHGNITFNVSLWIEALKDLKVKQEELSKNERMTRKKMVADMRALQVERVDTMYAYEHISLLQEAKVKEINEIREKEKITAQLRASTIA